VSSDKDCPGHGFAPDMGVDGLITNNTSLIWQNIALRGQQAL
jgi:hypothetical protein